MKEVTESTYKFYRDSINPNSKAAKFLSVYIEHHKKGSISDGEFIARSNAVTGKKIGRPVDYSHLTGFRGAA